jgi:hypothetical protein
MPNAVARCVYWEMPGHIIGQPFGIDIRATKWRNLAHDKVNQQPYVGQLLV